MIRETGCASLSHLWPVSACRRQWAESRKGSVFVTYQLSHCLGCCLLCTVFDFELCSFHQMCWRTKITMTREWLCFHLILFCHFFCFFVNTIVPMNCLCKAVEQPPSQFCKMDREGSSLVRVLFNIKMWQEGFWKKFIFTNFFFKDEWEWGGVGVLVRVLFIMSM